MRKHETVIRNKVYLAIRSIRERKREEMLGVCV